MHLYSPKINAFSAYDTIFYTLGAFIHNKLNISFGIFMKGDGNMAIKKSMVKAKTQVPVNKFFKTIEQMSLISGIGKNTLRLLVESGEIDYIHIGNRRLIADSAIWDWYERNKVTAAASIEGGESHANLQP